LTMSHNYLLDTYTYLHKRLDEIQPQLTAAKATQHTKAYAAGQIEAICDLERYLIEHYDMKLPRRLRRQKLQTAGVCEKKD
jgi:hypothetical protein